MIKTKTWRSGLNFYLIPMRSWVQISHNPSLSIWLTTALYWTYFTSGKLEYTLRRGGLFALQCASHSLVAMSYYAESLQTISEAESAGANTLSAHHSCPAWDDDVNDDILKKYDTKYLSGIAKRLNKENKGLNLTSSDANTFFAWCAYEINARGYSDICNIFTKDELVRFSYGQDLETYYQTGPGYDMIRSVGANLFNASVKLLKESEVQDQKVWLSFTHDTDILNYLTTIGIIDDQNNLTAEHVPFMENTFHRSWYVPQGARVYTEKFQCSNDTYVRYVINDAVVPIETCSTGPGFSCEINDFYGYAEKRVAGTDFLKVCNVSSVSNSTELTFFWDWNTKHYNDTLLKQ